MLLTIITLILIFNKKGAVNNAESNPFGRIVVFEESGHGAFYDELEKFNAELIRFIQP